MLPPGGNEFLNHANDSAAGLYVIFSQNWLHVPKQLKYVWSSTLPEGTIGRRNKIFRPWFFVLESGEANRGRWTFEQVDLERDHKLKLGGSPAARTIGLGLLRVETRSTSEASNSGRLCNTAPNNAARPRGRHHHDSALSEVKS